MHRRVVAYSFLDPACCRTANNAPRCARDRRAARSRASHGRSPAQHRLRPGLFAKLPDENINFGGPKAGNGDIEVRLDRQFLQLERQELAIPAGEFGQPVVGNHIRPDLRGRQVAGARRRNVTHAEQLCGLDPAVAVGDDAARAVDQDRIDKAEFLDTGGNLFDLLRRMGARIAAAAPQLSGVSIGYFEG